MKRQTKIWLCGFLLAGIISVCLLGHNAWAAEEAGGWRSTYDLVLKWINFTILVYVLVRFGKAPLMKFLLGQREKWAREIKVLEEEKQSTENQIEETLKLIEEGDSRLAELKARITQLGEQKKEEIIESARQQSQLMLKDAQHRLESRIVKAKNMFKSEMVDAAIDLALQRLPQEITAADNEKLTTEFVDSAQHQ